MDEVRKSYLKNRVVDLLSRRDHSEYELKQKLSRWATSEEVQFAISFAKDFNLIPTTEAQQVDLAQRFADSYSRKKLGSLKIQQKLHSKGLPKVTLEPEVELDNAVHLLTTRRSRSQKTLTKPQLIRYLMGKGFSLDIAQKALRLSGVLETGDFDEPAHPESNS